MHRKNVYQFRNAIEVEEFHTGRYGAPGQKRQPKKKPTKEQIEKRNQYNKEKRCRHRLRKYFDVNDYFVALTYAREARPPDMKAAVADFARFIRIVKREYRKRGEELRWIRNIEVGTKGAWHIHLAINRIAETDLILRKAWDAGRVLGELLYQKGEFRALAAYLTKTPKTDKRLREANYSTSRNMPLPEPKRKILKRWQEKERLRIPKGFYLEEETYHEGVNPVTGYRYRLYTLLRVRRE